MFTFSAVSSIIYAVEVGLIALFYSLALAKSSLSFQHFCSHFID